MSLFEFLQAHTINLAGFNLEKDDAIDCLMTAANIPEGVPVGPRKKNKKYNKKLKTLKKNVAGIRNSRSGAIFLCVRGLPHNPTGVQKDDQQSLNSIMVVRQTHRCEINGDNTGLFLVRENNENFYDVLMENITKCFVDEKEV